MMAPPYIPESTTELDAQLLRIDHRSKFVSKKLQLLMNDDSVRSYLSDYEIKALYHLASSYEALIDASNGKYEGVFDNAAEHVLMDFQFVLNIARSRKGINIRTVKGRGPLEEYKEIGLLDKIRPPIPEKPKDQQPMQNYGSDYNYQR